MSQNTKEDIIKKVKGLIDAPSCCAEAKEAAQIWLDSLGSDKEDEAAKNLIAELEEDIMPVDVLIEFAGSEAGEQIFGKETAQSVAAHGREIKAAGAQYCDCPACAAAAEILGNKEAIL